MTPEKRTTMHAPAPLSAEAAALEKLGHLAHKVCMMWGSPELDLFFSRLIMDSRDGARQGLPVEVASEVMFLARTNKLVRAIDLARGQGIAFKEAYQAIDDGDAQRIEEDMRQHPQQYSQSPALTPRSGHDRRDGLERRVEQRANADRRSGAERRHTSAHAATSATGQSSFGKTLLLAIACIVAASVVWPIIRKLL